MKTFGFDVTFGDKTYQEVSYTVIRTAVRMNLPETDRLAYADAENREGLTWHLEVEGRSRAEALADLTENLPDGCSVYNREED